MGWDGMGWDGSTRKKISEEREKLKAEVLKKGPSEHPDRAARAVIAWKNRDKLWEKQSKAAQPDEMGNIEFFGLQTMPRGGLLGCPGLAWQIWPKLCGPANTPPHLPTPTCPFLAR